MSMSVHLWAIMQKSEVMGSIQFWEGEWVCCLIILNFTSYPLLLSILVRVPLDKKQDIKYCNRKKKYGELVLENWKAIKDQWSEIRDRNCRKRLPPLGPGRKEVGEVNRTLKLGSWGAAELEPRTWRGGAAWLVVISLRECNAASFGSVQTKLTLESAATKSSPCYCCKEPRPGQCT